MSTLTEAKVALRLDKLNSYLNVWRTRLSNLPPGAEQENPRAFYTQEAEQCAKKLARLQKQHTKSI